MRQSSKFLVIVILMLTSSSYTVKAQGDSLFSKAFPDGNNVRLTSSTITEFRSRPRNANPAAPEQEIYSDREWKLVSYSLLLKRPSENKEEIIWKEYIDYPAADRKQYYVVGSLAVNDVLLRGDRAYILYARQGFVAVVNATKNKDGEWVWSAPTELARSTDVYPIVKWVFTEKAAPQIALDRIVRDKTITWIWNLKGERWVWVKK